MFCSTNEQQSVFNNEKFSLLCFFPEFFFPHLAASSRVIQQVVLRHHRVFSSAKLSCFTYKCLVCVVWSLLGILNLMNFQKMKLSRVTWRLSPTTTPLRKTVWHCRKLWPAISPVSLKVNSSSYKDPRNSNLHSRIW